MALLFFKYGLPILLGYTLFVGISGRYVPFMRPRNTLRRPAWLFGLWTGVAVAAVLSYGLHLAYQMDLNNVSELLAPGAWLLAASVIPGFLVFLVYRRRVNKALAESQAIGDSAEAQAESQSNNSDELDSAIVALTAETANDDDLDATIKVERFAVSEDDEDDSTIIWNSSDITDEADALDETAIFDVEIADTGEPLLVDTAAEDELDKTVAFIAPMDSSESDTAQASSQNISTSDVDMVETADLATSHEAEWVEDVELQEENNIEQPEVAMGDDADEHEPATEVVRAEAAEMAQLTDALVEIQQLRSTLDEEMDVRKELETHLRITRKGLAQLESESRGYEMQKAEALAEMERELEERVKRTAAAEARAEREADKVAALENEMVLLRQDTLKATKDSRSSMEARARALNTASKATTFARQAMQVRTRLETQLQEAETELESKQNTISSLIKALEKEKSRTQEDVASLAKQLVLHEKQLQARRTLEEVTRSVDNKLTNRLVKKVAKARG